jgi:YidC/Oxa1 family membrane protein insertase
MSQLFHTYLYEPILAVLVFIYRNLAFGDLGIAIVILTIFVRFILLPIFWKSAKDQALMARLRPQIRKIQITHKDNKEEQAKKLMALYREHKLNPFSGFFLILLQLPVFIALFQIFSRELNTATFDNHFFLGLINLEEKNIPIAAAAAVFQYIQGKMALKAVPEEDNKKDNNPVASAGKMMIWMGPIFTVAILSGLPSALSLYWLVSTLFSIGQQVFVNKSLINTNMSANNTND